MNLQPRIDVCAFYLNICIMGGAIVDRILKLGYSPVDVLLSNVCDIHASVIDNGAVDSLRTVLFNENFIKPWSDEYMLVKLLTRSF